MRSDAAPSGSYAGPQPALQEVGSRRRVQARLGGYRKMAIGLLVTDAVCIVVAFGLAHQIRFGLANLTQGVLLVLAVVPFVWIGVFAAFGLYGSHRIAFVEEFRRVLAAVSIGITFVVTASYWAKASLSRIWIGLSWLFAMILVVAARRAWRAWARREATAGRLGLRTAIVGGNGEGEGIVRRLRDPGQGFLPVGCLVAGDGLSVAGLPVLGSVDDFPTVLREHDLDCVFVASSAVDHDIVAELLRTARLSGVEVRISANVRDVLSSRLAVQPVGDLLALSLRPVKLTGPQAVLKRAFDIVGAMLLLIVSAPLLATIAIAIRVDSKGPAIFRQTRVTRGGRVFRMHKFRTMRTDAERAAREVGVDTTEAFFKMEDDQRVTRVGRWLRKTSLDELPQLWNALKGDMSLVGPRPLPADQVEANRELLAPRHEVRAGLTGWWQIHGRSDLDLEEALRMDTFYIENWSVGLDLYVLLRTVAVVLRGKGAY